MKPRAHTDLRSSSWVTNKHLLYIFFVLLMVGFSVLLIAPEPFNLIPFGLILGAVFIAATIVYPLTGLYCYLIFYLIRPQELLPYVGVMSYPYEKFFAIFVAFSIVVHYLTHGRKIDIFDLDLPISLFIGVMAISVFGAVWVGGAMDEFIVVFKIIIVYFFMTRIVDTEKKFGTVIWLYVISIGIIAVTSTYNYYSGHFEVAMHIDRAIGLAGQEGSLSDPNSMASSLVLGMPFVFYLLKHYRSLFIKLVLAGVMLAALWTVIISGSRGGMLGAIIMVGLIAYHSRHRTVAILIAVVTIVALATLAPDQYIDRFASIADFDNVDDGTGAADSAQGRIRGLMTGLEILVTRPVTGVGIGCFSVYNYDHNGTWLQPHNMVGQLTGELGFLGLLAFSFFVYHLVRQCRLIRRLTAPVVGGSGLCYNMATAAMISVGMLLFLGLFAHNLYRFNWYLFAGFVAIAAKLASRQQRDEDENEEQLTGDSVEAAGH